MTPANDAYTPKVQPRCNIQQRRPQEASRHTLSRAYLQTTYNTETCDKDVVTIMDQRGDAEQESAHINALQFLPVTEQTLTRIKGVTEADEDVHALKK